MILLLCQLAYGQVLRDVVLYPGSSDPRLQEVGVGPDALYAVRFSANGAVLEKREADLSLVWVMPLELPESVLLRHRTQPLHVLQGGGAVVVVVPLAQALAALVFDPVTGERVQTRKLAEYERLADVEVLVSPHRDCVALVDGGQAHLWGADLEDRGLLPAPVGARALTDDGQVVSVNNRGIWVNGTLAAMAGGDSVRRIRVAGTGDRLWVVGLLRGKRGLLVTALQGRALLWKRQYVGEQLTPHFGSAEQWRRLRLGPPQILEDGDVVVVAQARGKEDAEGRERRGSVVVQRFDAADGLLWTGVVPNDAAVSKGHELSLGLQQEALVVTFSAADGLSRAQVSVATGVVGAVEPLLPHDSGLGQPTWTLWVEDRLVWLTDAQLLVSLDPIGTPALGTLGRIEPVDTESAAYQAGWRVGSTVSSQHPGAALAGFGVAATSAAAAPLAAPGAGVTAGCIGGAAGAGATVVAAGFFTPAQPPTVFGSLPPEFRTGWVDGWRQTTRRRQMGWAVVGGVTGAVVGATALAGGGG